MITVIEGVGGSGKSLVLAALAKAEVDRGQTVYSNGPFSFNGWKPFDREMFLGLCDSKEELHDCSFCLDEAYSYMDSRNSASRLNKLFMYVVVQSRKRNVDFYLSTHHIDILDKRIRRAVDYHILCGGPSRGRLRLTMWDICTDKKSRHNVDFAEWLPLVTTGEYYIERYTKEEVDPALTLIKSTLGFK